MTKESEGAAERVRLETERQIAGIARQILKRLDELQISQAELARRSGVKRQNLNVALKAALDPGSKQFPSLPTIVRIAASVGIATQTEVVMTKKPFVLAIYNRGGGQGKTTTTMNLAYALVHTQGKRVLVIDGDHQSSLTKWLGYTPAAYSSTQTIEYVGVTEGTSPLPTPLVTLFGFDLIPSSETGLPRVSRVEITPDFYMRLRRSLADLTDYDVVLIDCPPDDSSPLAKMLLTAADELVVPMHATEKGLEGVGGALKAIESVKWAHPIGLRVNCLVVTNYSDREQYQRACLETLREDFSSRYTISTPIVHSALYARAGGVCKPLLAYLEQPDLPLQRASSESMKRSYADLALLTLSAGVLA